MLTTCEQNAMLPEVGTGREYFVSTPEETNELLAIEDQLIRTARQNCWVLRDGEKYKVVK